MKMQKLDLRIPSIGTPVRLINHMVSFPVLSRLWRLLLTSTIAVTLCSFAFNVQSSESRGNGLVDSSKERIVVTVPGDTFPTLGVKVFGSVGMGRLLAEYNGLAFDTVFDVGTEIIIPTHLQSKKNFATVAFVKGGSLLHIAGSDHAVKKIETGQRIYTTDVIVTDGSGFVSVSLSNGSVVNVQPDSRAELAELACMPRDTECSFLMDSQQGSVSADVKTREGQSNRFLIKTPYASAAVRGTVFDFDASPNALSVGVTEGQVALSTDDADLPLPTGYGSRTEAGKAPGEPVALLAEPILQAPLSRIGEEDKVAWATLSGAKSYLLAVSQDAQGSQEIYREKPEQPVHSFRKLPLGEVYLSIRGVDSNELKGFPVVQKLNIVSVDQNVPRPVLEQIVEGEKVFVNTIEQTDNVHELQFSQREDFATVIAVEVPPDGGAQQQLINDQNLYVRGRVIVNETTVGAYGPAILVQTEK